jgi:hypothetical protein
MLQEIAMTKILAPSTLAISRLDVFILHSTVMTMMHVPKITAPMENVFMRQSKSQLQKTNAKFLHVVQRMDSILMQRTVMTTILAPLILAILKMETASIKERIVMITTNVPSIYVMQQQELAHTLLSLALITIHAPEILVMQNVDVSTLLNSILLLFPRPINAIPTLATLELETW